MESLFPFIVLTCGFALLACTDISIRPLSRKDKQLLLGLAIFVMVVFAGCRWNARETPGDGIFDYAVYKYVFENPLRIGSFFNDLGSSDGYFRSLDIGYVFLSSLFSRAGIGNFHIFLLFFSAATVWLFYRGLQRNHISELLLFILFIYLTRLYFQYNFIIIRQAMAMAIVWWAIPFIYKQRAKFILLCLFAATIHFSAVIFLITPFLLNLRLSNRLIAILFSVLLVLGVTNITYTIIFHAVEWGISLLGLGRLMAYIEGMRSGINPLNFIEIIPFLYLALRFKKALYETSEGRLFFNMLIFYVIYLLLTMNFMGLTRMSSYFLYSYFYIANFALSRMKNKREKLLLGGVLCVYFLIYGLRFISANFVLYPYDFWLFHL